MYLPWLASAVGAVAVVCVHARMSATHTLCPLQRRRMLACSIRTISAMCWPSVLFACVSSEHRSPALLWLPLLWSYAVWNLDTFLLFHGKSTDPDETPATLRMDPTPLCGLAFGLCTLLGARDQTKHANLFLYAILGCFVFVLPSHNLHPGSNAAQAFESVQKSLLIYCVGGVIAGVVVSRLSTEKVPP